MHAARVQVEGRYQREPLGIALRTRPARSAGRGTSPDTARRGAGPGSAAGPVNSALSGEPPAAAASYQRVHVGRTLGQMVRVGERQRLAQHGDVRLLPVRRVRHGPRDTTGPPLRPHCQTGGRYNPCRSDGSDTSHVTPRTLPSVLTARQVRLLPVRRVRHEPRDTTGPPLRPHCQTGTTPAGQTGQTRATGHHGPSPLFLHTATRRLRIL